MSSNATLGVENRAHKRKRERSDAIASNAGEAIPGLLNDIVVTHVLRTEHFDDPANLARLPAVSRAMRDAVASKYSDLRTCVMTMSLRRPGMASPGLAAVASRRSRFLLRARVSILSVALENDVEGVRVVVLRGLRESVGGDGSLSKTKSLNSTLNVTPSFFWSFFFMA